MDNASDSETDNFIEKPIPTEQDRLKALELLQQKPKRKLNISDEERKRRSEAMTAVRQKRYLYDEIRREEKEKLKHKKKAAPIPDVQEPTVQPAPPKRKLKAVTIQEAPQPVVQPQEPTFTLAQLQQLMALKEAEMKPKAKRTRAPPKQKQAVQQYEPVQQYAPIQQPVQPQLKPWQMLNGKPIVWI